MKVTDGAKIFIKNDALNKYLFVLRDNKPNIPEPNMWGLLGGGIEQNERPIDTVKREIKEELDIEVFNIKHIYSKKKVHTVQGQEYEINGHYFMGETNIEDLSNIVLNEGQKASFFSLEEINSKENVSPTIKELIAVCKEELK
ncbi:MAG: NUDIX domain-containing protein [bacterium]